jgi:translation initiation factor IF-3
MIMVLAPHRATKAAAVAAVAGKPGREPRDGEAPAETAPAATETTAE